ncbi:hypothetical protein D1872_196820 [compost metagenome]
MNNAVLKLNTVPIILATTPVGAAGTKAMIIWRKNAAIAAGASPFCIEEIQFSIMFYSKLTFRIQFLSITEE